MSAELQVVHDGYAATTGWLQRSSWCGTATSVVVVDPGMVADRRLILEPLAAAGVRPEDVTDVVISHHHPDHTWHVGLFPAARLHDAWAVYRPTSGTTSPPRAGRCRRTSG